MSAAPSLPVARNLPASSVLAAGSVSAFLSIVMISGMSDARKSAFLPLASATAYSNRALVLGAAANASGFAIARSSCCPGVVESASRKSKIAPEVT